MIIDYLRLPPPREPPILDAPRELLVRALLPLPAEPPKALELAFDPKTFYATLPGPARVGMEATCDAQWVEKVPQEHHHELWIGDAAEIRAAMVRKQKTDPRDALHILDLLLANRFPASGYRHRRSGI